MNDRSDPKSILIIATTYVTRDPRVWRQLQWLKDHYRVTVAGFGEPDLPGVAFHTAAKRPRPTGLLKQARLFLKMQAAPILHTPVMFHPLDGVREFAKLRSGTYDGVVVNDAEALPLALQWARGAPVLFDAHEYYPREWDGSFLWRVFDQPYWRWVCRTFIPQCAAVSTVCEGIADEFRRQCQARHVEVIVNAPAHEALAPSPLDPGHVRLIHHGGAMPGRQLEKMIEVMDHVDRRFHLDMMLTATDPAYAHRLRELAAARTNVSFREPVAMPDIARTINSYDLGLYLLDSRNFNDVHALPNKFFEFIQARLGVIIGPSPEMARIVRAEELGIVAESFVPRTVAEQLNKLGPEDIMRFKQNAARAALRYNAEENGKTFLALVKTIVK